MEVEQPAVPDSEVVEQTASEPVEVSAEAEEGQELEQVAEPTEPTEEEVEYEGEKFKVPAKLKDALLRQADYTRKTQEVAEQRKAIEAQREQVTQQAQFQQENAQAIGQLVNVDQRLAQLQNVNWQALNQQDPQQAQALHIEFTQLQSQRGQLTNYLTQKQQQKQWNEQQESAKRLHEAEAFIKREIKDWSDTKNLALEAYAKSEGIDTKALGKLVLQSPAVMKLVDKAARYDQLVKTQATKPKPEAQEKPVTRIAASKSAANTDPDKRSPEAWLKWRNAQVNKR